MMSVLSLVLLSTVESLSNMFNVDPNKVLKGVIVAYRYSILMIDIALFFVKAIFEYFRITYRFFVPIPKRDLCGEIAVITGAGQGIGRQLALQLSQQGCIVVCLDIQDQSNDKTVQLIKEDGGQAYAYTCNVASWENVESTIQRIQKEVGDIDILVNNAGVMICRPFIQHNSPQIENIIQTNLLGQLWLLRATLPQMLAKNKGSIVAMSSVAGHAGAPNMVPYTASKFGVRGMMEALYIELRQENPNHKIHLMTVSPFMVDTVMLKSPRIRFPGLLDIVTASEAATIIISNLRMRTAIVFIPNAFYYLQCFVRILPSRVQLLLTDFIDTGIGIDYTN